MEHNLEVIKYNIFAAAIKKYFRLYVVMLLGCVIWHDAFFHYFFRF